MARATNKLTSTQIKSATFEKYGKRTKLADGGGLYLDIQPGGRYWRMKYRYAGKEKLLALGVYSETTLKEARAARDEARKLLANEIDPAAYRRQSESERRDAAANTFRAVAIEWLEQVHKKAVGATTYPKNGRRLEMHVYPKLGARPLTEIEPPEILEVLRVIENKGHVDNAHRLKTLIGQVFRYGVSTGRAKRDVTADLRGILPAPEVKHHAAVITPDEIARLLNVIDSALRVLASRQPPENALAGNRLGCTNMDNRNQQKRGAVGGSTGRASRYPLARNGSAQRSQRVGISERSRQGQPHERERRQWSPEPPRIQRHYDGARIPSHG